MNNLVYPKTRIIFLICLMAVLGLLLTACNLDIVAPNPAGTLQQATSPIEDPYQDYEQYAAFVPIDVPDAPTQGISQRESLRLSMRHPLTLNPLLNQDVTVAKILRLIFEPLITLDHELRPTSHLADIEFASDFSTINLTIRSDAFWSDGTPVTADDIIFSVNTIRNASQNSIYHSNVQNISAITRVSSRGVIVHFYQPSIYAGNALNFPIIPQHHYRNQTNPASPANMAPVGNGPFMLYSLSHMNSLTMVQNPYSFRQRPQINQVEVVFLPDNQTALHAFNQGRIDALPLPLTDWARQHSVRPITHQIVPAMYFEFVGFNFERDIFSNVQIRRGIAQAFDAEGLINALYLNHAVRATSPVHPYYWAAQGQYNTTYNPSRAQALLSTIYLEDEPWIIIANNNNPQRVAIANQIAANLTNLGVPTQAQAIPAAEYFARLDSGDFDLFVGGVNLGFIANVQFFFQGGFYMEDTTLQTSFAAVSQAFTEADYIQAIYNFTQDFAYRVPVIGLAFRHSAVLTHQHVNQSANPSPGNVFGDVNLWSLGW